MKRLAILLVAAGFITASASAFILPAPRVHAVSGGDWKAGRIIDDSVFYNSSSMTADQIQQFLNAKVPTCDNGGTQPYNGSTRRTYSESKGVTFPLTCLKDYYENTTTHANNLSGQPVPAGAKSAAQIIWDVSQTYGINPQVLIVLLQKEQSLITDDWPWPVQYQKATGYACPDTADCDSKYYGFYNQVDSAAWQFRKYAQTPNSFNYAAGAINNIRYNPNAACGQSAVYIDNQATASLYNYTPYQPNASALANLYGTGDSCGAYGNRNFWRMFSDWFGSTFGDPISGAVYRVYNPITGDWLLTLSPTERDMAATFNNYWMNDGVVFQGFPSYESGTVPVYRLSRANTHLYTTSLDELDNAVTQYGFINEGVKFYAQPAQTASSRPVYRLTKNGKYFYTVNVFEKQDMLDRGYTLEGVPFYAYSEGTRLPVYRLSRNGQHFYTQNGSEKLLAERSGYSYEGATFDAPTAVTADCLPIYRLVRDGKYFYTINRGERDAAVLLYGYKSQGVAFYGYPVGYASTQPVSRLARPNPEDHLYTPSTDEASAAATTYGYQSEGMGFSR
ncbi:MAG TPA: hypothetical protein VLE73_04840 [Candidatus Saccharimonadales bacterium]|nr:hypothetical protein [Candidatus Saccharimonadales bacterium]